MTSEDVDLVRALFTSRILALHDRQASMDELRRERERLVRLAALPESSDSEFLFDFIVGGLLGEGVVGFGAAATLRPGSYLGFCSAARANDGGKGRAMWDAVQRDGGGAVLATMLIENFTISGPEQSFSGHNADVHSRAFREEGDRGGKVVLIGAISLILISLTVGVAAVLLQAS